MNRFFQLDCRTWPERRPVNTLLKPLVWLKNCFERKSKLRRSMRVEMCQALLGFVDAWDVARWNPPQGNLCGSDLVEPLMSVPDQLLVSSPVNIVLKVLHRLPN